MSYFLHTINYLIISGGTIMNSIIVSPVYEILRKEIEELKEE